MTPDLPQAAAAWAEGQKTLQARTSKYQPQQRPEAAQPRPPRPSQQSQEALRGAGLKHEELLAVARQKDAPISINGARAQRPARQLPANIS